MITVFGVGGSGVGCPSLSKRWGVVAAAVCFLPLLISPDSTVSWDPLHHADSHASTVSLLKSGDIPRMHNELGSTAPCRLTCERSESVREWRIALHKSDQTQPP